MRKSQAAYVVIWSIFLIFLLGGVVERGFGAVCYDVINLGHKCQLSECLSICDSRYHGSEAYYCGAPQTCVCEYECPARKG